MKPKIPRDKRYLKWISNLPCLICQAPAPSIAHHCQPIGKGGKGIKTSDYRCVQLCHKHHDEIHRGRITFAKKYGFDQDHVIGKLNEIWFNILNETGITSELVLEEPT